MSLPKLIYFDIYGLGEGSRLLFAAAGAQFEDCRIDLSSMAGPEAKGNQTAITWPAYKSETPYGQLPVLIVDGVKIAQSGAIQRYIAARYGLNGLGLNEFGLVQATLEQLRDIQDAYGKINALPKDEQAAARAKFVAELATNGQVAALEAQLKANNGGNGWIVGNNLTAADVAIYRLFGMTLRGVDADAFKKSCPAHIQALIGRVESHANIAKYLASRPARPF